MFANPRAPFARFAFAILLLLGILASPALRELKAASDGGVDHTQVWEKLSRHDREEVFDDVWETIDEKYVDPSFNGVDWKAVRERYRPMVDAVKNDDDFFALMKKMVGELHDAHTRFQTPRERRDREQSKTVSAGVSIYEVEGKVVITGVEPDSEAETAGVENGMFLRTIDGKPLAEQLRATQAIIGGSSSERHEKLRLYTKLLDGEPGTTVKLGLEDAEEKLIEVTLTRHIVADDAKVTWRRLASGYSYIKLSLWRSPVHKEFRRVLESFRNAPGVIIDLRGNPGGEANEVIKIASLFFNSRVPFGRFISRSGKAITLFTERDEQVYKGAVVILVNEGSGSGSELFSGVMQENGRAMIIGRQSCGCVLGITRFKKLEGGSELAVSELRYISPRGQKFEGAGITPDRIIALTIADLQSHRDAAIEAAENLLKTRKQA